MTESPLTEAAPPGASPSASTGAPPRAPTRAPLARRWSLKVGVVGLVVIAVAGLVGWATLPVWRPYTPRLLQRLTAPLLVAGSGDEASGLRQELDALTTALSAMKTTQSSAESRLRKLEEAVPSDLSDLTARVDALQKSLEAVKPSDLRSALQSAPQSAPQLAPLSAPLSAATSAGVNNAASAEQVKVLTMQVDSLSQRLKDLAAGTAQATVVLALGDRIALVEKSVQAITARQDRAVAFLLAVSQLREAAQSGGAFVDQLKAVRALAPSDVSVETITADFAPWAERGIPQGGALSLHFAQLAPTIIRARVVADLANSSNFWTQTLARLSSVLTITRLDGAGAGGDTAAIVARVQGLLQASDLPAAVSEAKQLDGAAAATVKPWMLEARAHLAAIKGLAILTSEAVTRIGAATIAGAVVAPGAAGAGQPTASKTGG